MRRRVALLAAVLAVGSGCKPRMEAGSAVKEREEGGDLGDETEGPSGVENMAFDVNDVSILFPFRDGDFYPHVEITDDIWPMTAFKPMMEYASGIEGTKLARELLDNEENSPKGASKRHRKDGEPAWAETSAGGCNFDGKVLVNAFCVDGKVLFDAVAPDSANVKPTGQKSGSKKFIDLRGHPEAKDRKNWRIVSLRIDPCAAQHNSECEVEFRLIAQPVGKDGQVLDYAAHLLYHLGDLSVQSGRVQYGKRFRKNVVPFSELVKLVQAVKFESEKAPETSTSGAPLGVHPGLAAENPQAGNIASAVQNLIARATKGGLTTVTTMQLSGLKEPWTFFQGAVVPNQGGRLVWQPDFITGGTPSYYIRTAHAPGGFPITGTQPPPSNPVNTNNLFAADGKDRFIDALALDNPGRFGDEGAGSGTGEGGREKFSVLNTDCITCHTTATRAQALSVPVSRNREAMANLYMPRPGITGYLAPEVVPRAQYDFRNFGYFVPRGKTEHEPRVMTRTLNESAEVAAFFNAEILPVIYSKKFKNPGYTCGDAKQNSIDENKHAALWDCLIVDKDKRFANGPSHDAFRQCFTQVARCDNDGPRIAK